MASHDWEDTFSRYGGVEELELDDTLWEHLQERGTYAKHEVLLGEIVQVFTGSPRFFLNSSPSGRAPLIMVGPTDGGHVLCIPIEPTGRHGIWRPVPAFEANTHHRRRYRGE